MPTNDPNLVGFLIVQGSLAGLAVVVAIVIWFASPRRKTRPWQDPAQTKLNLPERQREAARQTAPPLAGV